MKLSVEKICTLELTENEVHRLKILIKLGLEDNKVDLNLCKETGEEFLLAVEVMGMS